MLYNVIPIYLNYQNLLFNLKCTESNYNNTGGTLESQSVLLVLSCLCKDKTQSIFHLVCVCVTFMHVWVGVSNMQYQAVHVWKCIAVLCFSQKWANLSKYPWSPFTVVCVWTMIIHASDWFITVIFFSSVQAVIILSACKVPVANSKSSSNHDTLLYATSFENIFFLGWCEPRITIIMFLNKSDVFMKFKLVGFVVVVLCYASSSHLLHLLPSLPILVSLGMSLPA